MSRHARDRSRSKSQSNTPKPLSSRVFEDNDLEEKLQVFKGPDEGSKKAYDINELRKITVNIIRKVPQKKGLEKPKVLFDPTTVAPVRRPDEGKRPIFERKELLEWSKTSQGKSEDKLMEISPVKIKDKKKHRSESPSPDEKSWKKEISPVRKRVASPPSHMKSRGSSGGDYVKYKEKDETDSLKNKNDQCSGHRNTSDSSKYKDDYAYKQKSERRYVEKYEREKESSPGRSRRRSKDRRRSRSPSAYRGRSRRSRSYRTRSRSRSRSRSYSYDRRSRSHSYERRRSRSRDRRGRSHSKHSVRTFIEEREYLKMLRRKMKERDDKRLKEESMRMQELKEKIEEKEGPKKDIVKSTDRSHVTATPRVRPPRMRPMFRHPPMMPYPMPYPPVPHMFRPPPFRPYPPPYPPQRFYPSY